MDKIYNILKEHRIKIIDKLIIDKITDKDGVLVFRIKDEKQSKILKVFENEIYKREISNYKLLSHLKIKTIKTYSFTENSILMEDIVSSNKYRLATKEDMYDLKVLEPLANWYKELHLKGRKYLEKTNLSLYSEYDSITLESLNFLNKTFNIKQDKSWEILKKELKNIKEILNNKRTLVYNDFYFTNMVVSKDYSEAFMFDYNMLGQGVVSQDIFNVVYSTSVKFQEYYGKTSEIEEIINRFLAHIFSCLQGNKKNNFPSRAQSSLNYLNSLDFSKDLDDYLRLRSKY